MAVILFSGGLDSTTCLALDPDPVPVVVDYGQPAWVLEHQSAMRVVEARGLEAVVVSARLPWIQTGSKAMVIPGRNIILLALAASVALERGIEDVTIGANHDDYENYVDCRQEFFDAAGLALGVKINTPLIHMEKPEIADLARRHGVDVDATWSCYYPSSESAGQPCGECDACAGRIRALA